MRLWFGRHIGLLGQVALSALIGAFTSGCVERGVPLSGAVDGSLRTLRGEPLVGSAVRLSGAIEAATLVAPDGTFHFDGVPVGSYLVSAAVDHTLETIVTAPVLVSGDAPTTVTLSLTGVGSLSGRVELEDAASSDGTRVVVAGSPALALTDQSGNFAFAALPEGEVTLYAVHEGYAPALLGSAFVTRAGTASLGTHTLARVAGTTAPFDGHAVYPGRSAHAGITVTLEGTSETAVTDATGAFHFEHAPLGVVTLRCTDGDYSAHVAPLFLDGSGGGIVLAGRPYELPTVSLTLGQWRSELTSSTVYASRDERWLYWSENQNAGPSARAIAFDIASGARYAVDHAYIAALHPDGSQALVYRYQAAPSSARDLVAWAPASQSITTVYAAVDGMQVLEQRNAVLVTTPAIQLIPLSGGPTITLAQSNQGYQITVGAAQTTALLTRLSPLETSLWVDLETGSVLYSTQSGEALYLAQGGESALIVSTSGVEHLARKTLTRHTLATSRVNWSLSPTGRYLVWDTHLVDLTTLSDLGPQPTGTPAPFSPNDLTRLSVSSVGDGIDVVARDVATGAAPAPYHIAGASVADILFPRPRVALVQVPRGGLYDVHRIDLDTGSGQLLLEGARRSGLIAGGRYHVPVARDGRWHGFAIDVDAARADDLGYLGVPLAASPDGGWVAVRDGDHVALVDAVHQAEYAVLDGSELAPPRALLGFTWRSDGSLLIQKAVASMYDDVFPSADHMGDGIYLVPTPPVSQ